MKLTTPQIAVLALAGILAGYFLVRRPISPVRSEQPSGSKMQVLAPAAPGEKSVQVNRDRSEVKRRQAIYAAESRLNIRPFAPDKKDGSFNFQLSYEPVRRFCVNGDIDLIEKAVGPNASFLLTLENDSGRPIIKPKKLSLSELKKPFKMPVSIPALTKPQYIRLMLCTQTSSESCIKLPPLDFDSTEKKALAGSKMISKDFTVFSHSLRVDEDAIKIFDSRQRSQVKQYLALMKLSDGGDGNKAFIENFIESSRKIKPMPIIIKGQEMTLNLYHRDDTGCFP
jgi:hypothetical protein